MNRCSDKLDKLIGKNVIVTFWDGDEREGILEFNRPYWGLKFGSNKYSIYKPNEGALFFRKSHVKKIREIEVENDNR